MPPTAKELTSVFTAPLRLDLDDGAKRRRFMVLVGRAVQVHGHVPPAAGDLFRRLLSAWEADVDPEADALLNARAEIWQILGAKHAGKSSRISDEIDRSLRALLCLAEPLDDSSDLWDLADWAAEMLSSDPLPKELKLS